MYYFALLSLCVAVWAHEVIVGEHEILGQLSGGDGISQHLVNPDGFAERKRDLQVESYVNVTNNVTVTSWTYSLSMLAVGERDTVFALSRTAQNGLQAVISRNGAVQFSEISDVDCNRDLCFGVISSPEFPRIGIFVTTRNAIYVTRDNGNSWTRHAIAKKFVKYRFHPSREDWIMALEEIRYPDYTMKYFPYVSKDYGQTWNILQLPDAVVGIADGSWCRAGLDGLSEGRLCIIGGDYYFYQTNDEGRTWGKPVTKQTIGFYVHDRFITLQVRSNGTSAILYVSSDNGRTFHVPYLPYDVTISGFDRSQWIEDDNGVLWLAIAQNPAELSRGVSTPGNLYQSDATGDDFVLTLKDLHGKYNHWDYHVVKTIEGTILANVMKKGSQPPVVTSTITFDNGNVWQPLTPPRVDSLGQPIACFTDPSKPVCNLHLFGVVPASPDATFTQFYSADDAIGLILGTGNVGASLDMNSDNVNTYLSRDGGITWDEIFKGPTQFNFGDHGSLIVLAKKGVPTNEVYFSWNAGQNFSVVYLPVNVTVYAIVTASAQSEMFIVVGMRGIVRSFWGLDFSKLHARDCVAEDYEQWTQSSKCVLGHNIYWRRRKKSAECFTEDGVNHVLRVENCPCTAADYECDINYDRVVQNGKCVFNGDEVARDKLIEEKCSDGQTVYNISNGYRKIPGDTCISDGNTAQFEDIKTKACPSTTVPPNYFLLGLIVVLLVLLFVAVVVIVGFCFAIRDERFRKMFPWVNQAPAWVTAGYSNTLIDEVVTGDEFNGQASPESSLSGLSDESLDLSM